jgi:foldase protein PrsA
MFEMRRLIWKTFLLVVALASTAAAKKTTLPADAAASVNGYVISAKLFSTLLKNDQETLRIDPQTTAGKEKLKRTKTAVLDGLIERMLIVQEAEKRGVAPAEAEVDQAEKKVLSTFGGEERYRDFLAENGLSREEYRKEVVRAALCRERLAQTLGQEKPVTEAEIKSYYDAHRSEPAFQMPERVSAAHINIDTRHDVLAARLQHDQPALTGEELEKAITDEKTRRGKLASDLRQQLLAGADFAELAAKYSDDPGTRNQGGDLGAFPRRAHPHEFEEAAFGLKQPGDLSAVVEDFYGLHIIKLKEHQSAHAVTMAEATPEIRARLERQHDAENFQAWLKKAHSQASILTRDL